MVFTRKTSKTCANHDNSINLMGEKLRVIEITERKKCGFNSLYFNLLVHISLFCIQGAILFTLNHQDAHPKVMLQVGVLLFWIFLLVGFVIKLVEIFRWNRLQKHLKHEIEEMSLDYINSTSNSAFAEQDDDSKTISVLFTRSHDPISELVYWVSGRQYTHASIGLDANNECFYSFIGQGFRCEHPSHRKLKNHRKVSLCYQFKVSSEEYYQLENTSQM
jgi:hypothetical protein